MKHLTFLYGILAIALLHSCKKEQELATKSITITSVSTNQVSYFDTLTVLYTAFNLDDVQHITARIDNKEAEILTNTENQITLVVPYGISNGLLYLEYPGINAASYYLTYIKTFQINSVSPTSGKGGDILRIKGWGFGDLADPYQLIVNSLPVTLTTESDTLLEGSIPEGCGHGSIQIRLYQSRGSYNGGTNYIIDSIISCDFFHYEFTPYSGNALLSEMVLETDDGSRYTHTYQRNVDGSLNQVFTNGILSEDYRYGLNGLIDTIYFHSGGSLRNYQIVEQDNENNTITRDYYKISTNELYYSQIFHTSNSQITYAETHTTSTAGSALYLYQEHTYQYSNDYTTINSTIYNSDGSIRSTPFHSGYVDINNLWPNEGIPGYEPLQTTIWNYYDNKTYHNYYNEYGLLVKSVTCPLGLSERVGTIITYAYE